MPLALVAGGLLVFAGFGLMRLDEARLRGLVVENLPVKAVQFVQQQGYAGPLYNEYIWGGYLMWTLRIPVSIDGRAALQGSDRIGQFGATWSGEPTWKNDPELAKAGLVIGPVKAPLVQILRMDSRFKLAYEDDVAAVFIARKY
jgi:hypothetical protein